MYYGVDAVDVDRQPIEKYSPARSLYFIAFLLLASFFVLNMFVGVVVESFHNCHDEQDREPENRRQEQCQDDQATYSQYPPWRQRLYDLCINKYFDLAIAAVIVINVATMSLEYYQMPWVSHQSIVRPIYIKSVLTDCGGISRVHELFLHCGVHSRIGPQNRRTGTETILWRQVCFHHLPSDRAKFCPVAV